MNRIVGLGRDGDVISVPIGQRFRKDKATVGAYREIVATVIAEHERRAREAGDKSSYAVGRGRRTSPTHATRTAPAATTRGECEQRRYDQGCSYSRRERRCRCICASVMAARRRLLGPADHPLNLPDKSTNSAAVAARRCDHGEYRAQQNTPGPQPPTPQSAQSHTTSFKCSAGSMSLGCFSRLFTGSCDLDRRPRQHIADKYGRNHTSGAL